MKKKKKKTKKVKIRYGRVFIFILILGLLIYLFIKIFHFPIKNIFISGNNLLSDQEIIDLAGISDYPSIFSVTTYGLEKKIEKNSLVKNATVKKKRLKEVYIEIEENYPLFYDTSAKKTILKDGAGIKEQLKSPILLNYVPDKIYKDFVLKMSKLSINIINRISEIKYDPNSVDEERFLLTMNDGNYVYLTLIHFNKINNYVDIIKNFTNQKGVLYLDSGEYFKVYEQ